MQTSVSMVTEQAVATQLTKLPATIILVPWNKKLTMFGQEPQSAATN